MRDDGMYDGEMPDYARWERQQNDDNLYFWLREQQMRSEEQMWESLEAEPAEPTMVSLVVFLIAALVFVVIFVAS